MGFSLIPQIGETYIHGNQRFKWINGRKSWDFDNVIVETSGEEIPDDSVGAIGDKHTVEPIIDENGDIVTSGTVYVKNEEGVWVVDDTSSYILNTPSTSSDILFEKTLTVPANISGFGEILKADGDYMIAGGHWDTGEVYVFDKDQNLLHTLTNPNRSGTDDIDDDLFGHSVDISGDYCIVGARQEDTVIDGTDVYSSGKAYIFNLVTGNLVTTIDTPLDISDAPLSSFAGKVAINGTKCCITARNLNASYA